jgi:hypothetical protein
LDLLSWIAMLGAIGAAAVGKLPAAAFAACVAIFLQLNAVNNAVRKGKS